MKTYSGFRADAEKITNLALKFPYFCKVGCLFIPDIIIIVQQNTP